MYGQDNQGFFRGRELSRFLILLTITLVGWGALYYYATRPTEEPEPELVATGKPLPITPDKSPEFETVTDKTQINFRDMAAYVKLLNQAREKEPAAMSADARRDVFYAQIWDTPSDYRGVLMRITGTALRSLYYQSESSKTGWIYEVWVNTPDLPKNPYVCLSEEVPKGFPIGQNISERVAFEGYFLKLMRYTAGDVPRGAPVLIGRINWKARVDNSARNTNRTFYWLVGGLGVMFMISLARWGLALRRSFGSSAASKKIERPNDVIAPEDLAAFLADAPEELEETDGP